MRDASEIHSCRIPVLAAFLACLCLLPATAQKNKEPGPPKYDMHTETKMKVTVDEVKLPPKGSEKEGAHLLVKSGTDSVDVYLWPGRNEARTGLRMMPTSPHSPLKVGSRSGAVSLRFSLPGTPRFLWEWTH
jgi:hypothetical protein